MDLVLRTNELMPAGKPDFLSIVKYPMIKDLIESEGKKKMLAVMVLLVKDFCSSINCVRNMNEDQMIEAGAMLLEECANFRLEDYVMMFSMAKKGSLTDVKLWDRVDIQIISQIADQYWLKRDEAGEKAQAEELEKIEQLSAVNPSDRLDLIWDGKSGYVKQETMDDKLLGFSGAMGELKNRLLREGLVGLNEDEARKQIIKKP